MLSHRRDLVTRCAVDYRDNVWTDMLNCLMIEGYTGGRRGDRLYFIRVRNLVACVTIGGNPWRKLPSQIVMGDKDSGEDFKWKWI